MKTKWIEPERELPVLYPGYEIAVVGGGIAGVSAALAAGREGKKVLLLERMYGLGGLATLGLVTIYLPLCDGKGHQVSFGIVEELLKLSIKYGYECDYPKTWIEGNKEHGLERYKVRYNAQVFEILLEQILQEAGVYILYGTKVCNVFKEKDCIKGLVVENKDGRSVIPIDGVIDATGDADLFSMADDKTNLYEKGNNLAAWFYETKDGNTKLHMIGAADVLPEDKDAAIPDEFSNKRISGIDAKEVSEALIGCHRNSLEVFLKEGEVSERHSLTTIASIPQLRMTRRIDGCFTLDECDSYKNFNDSIGMIGDWRKRGPIYEIPFGCLHSNKYSNMLAAGRCISVTDNMWDISRVIPPAAVTGQAAGVAISLNRSWRKLSVDALQRELLRQGVRLHIKELGL